jgi:hypothetical protein
MEVVMVPGAGAGAGRGGDDGEDDVDGGDDGDDVDDGSLSLSSDISRFNSSHATFPSGRVATTMSELDLS